MSSANAISVVRSTARRDGACSICDLPDVVDKRRRRVRGGGDAAEDDGRCAAAGGAAAAAAAVAPREGAALHISQTERAQQDGRESDDGHDDKFEMAREIRVVQTAL